MMLATPISAVADNVAFIGYDKSFWQVYTVDAQGSELKKVSKSKYDKNKVSWYPNGEHVLVNGSQGELVKLNLETGAEEIIDLPFKDIADAVISPDGTRIAFSTTAAAPFDQNDIWVANADGSKPEKLTRMTGLQYEPVWSRDGKKLYFLSNTSVGAIKTYDIFELELQSKNISQLTSGKLNHFDIAIDASENIAFTNNRTGDYEVWIKRAGGKEFQLTNSVGVDAKPSWSPDSGAIVFESAPDGVPNIWRYDFADQSISPLTKFERGARAPAWYPGVSK